jgi:hypothetical protein
VPDERTHFLNVSKNCYLFVNDKNTKTNRVMKEGVSEKGFVENFYFCLAPGRFFPPERNEVGAVSGEIAGAQISQ